MHCAVRERLSDVGRSTQCAARNQENQENRGKSQKSHEGDNRPQIARRAKTDMTPDDYFQVVEKTDLTLSAVPKIHQFS